MTDEEAGALYAQISRDRLGGDYTGYKSLAIEAMQAATRVGYRQGLEEAREKCTELIANYKGYPYVGHLKRWDKYQAWLDAKLKEQL